MVLSQTEIAKARRERLDEICRRFLVDILYVFGSRSMEVYHWLVAETGQLPASDSDVDVGVKPADQAVFTVNEKVNLALELEDLFEVPRIDLVSLHDAGPQLAAEIIRGERLYARDNYLADEYDLFVLRREGDLLPLERERINLVLRRQ